MIPKAITILSRNSQIMMTETKENAIKVMMITKQQMMITNHRIRNTLMITKQRNTQIMITKTNKQKKKR